MGKSINGKSYTYAMLREEFALKAPLLMLDSAFVAQDSLHAIGRKLVSQNEAVFTGHFPSQPILPGVLQIGGMVQLASLIFHQQNRISYGQRPVLRRLKRIKFRKPVLPGACLSYHVQLLEQREDGEMDFQASCELPEGLASGGILTLAPAHTIPPPNRDLEAPVAMPFQEEREALPRQSTADLMRLLPHRPPFLLIDQSYGVGGTQKEIYGIRNVTATDALLATSGAAFYPPFLIVESAAQLGCAHILAQPGNAGKLGIFLGIDEANFYQEVLPGDQLFIRGRCDIGSRAGMAVGEYWVNGCKVSDSQMKFILLDSIQ